MKYRLKTYFRLFAVNLFISAFTFGGGYVVVPMVRRFFVEKSHDFSEEELLDMAAVAQSAPGAIAVNLSALAGYRIAKTAGVLVSCAAAILPPLIILAVISAFYSAFISNPVVSAVLKGMEAGVAALMVDLVADMCSAVLKKRSLFLSALIPIAFIANFIFNINVALILALSCAACALRFLFLRARTPDGGFERSSGS